MEKPLQVLQVLVVAGDTTNTEFVQKSFGSKISYQLVTVDLRPFAQVLGDPQARRAKLSTLKLIVVAGASLENVYKVADATIRTIDLKIFVLTSYPERLTQLVGYVEGKKLVLFDNSGAPQTREGFLPASQFLERVKAEVIQ